MEMYFKAIDPLGLNKQGEDSGTRYRTGIYYCDTTDPLFSWIAFPYICMRCSAECSMLYSLAF